MKCRIYINRHTIAANKKHGESEPPIAVRTYKGVEYAQDMVLTGEWRLKYDAPNAICSGATVWLEGKREDVKIC